MELLEREQCLLDLTGWMDAAARDQGCMVLLGGEAGIGKTALLQQFAGHVQGSRVLWGACDALFTPRPLAPLHDIAQQAQGALLAALSSAASAGAIFTAALAELQRMKALVVFEDVHWADEATIDLLKFLGRRIHRTHVMLALSYRDDELGARHPLRGVMGDLPRASTHRMTLAPLSEAAVVRLASAAGRPAAGVHGVTGGNPLFVTELLAGVAGAVPATVRDAVLARAMKLEPAARRLAELISVVPGKTEPWLLDRAAHPEEAAIEGCLGIGMVRSDDGSLAFRHELARRAFEDSLSQPRRRELHARVLEALVARPGCSAARAAQHADGARDRAQVLRYATLAAREAASVGAHREAASHYRIALRYADGLAPVERAGLYSQLAYESYMTGEYELSFEAQRSALEVWRGQGLLLKEGDSLRWLSRLSWILGHGAEAARYCAEAVSVLEPLPSSPELAMAYSNRADLAMECHEADIAIESAQRAIVLAETWNSPEILCEASTALGTMRLIVGDTSGWADLNRSLELALANGLQEQAASAYTDLGAMAVSRRQYEQASGYLAAGLRYCEERDLDFCLPYILAYRARLRFEQGDWKRAAEDIDAVLRQTNTRSNTKIPALRTLAHLRVRRGDPAAAGAIREARALAGPNPELQRAGMLALVAAEAAWLAADPEGVLREVRPVFEVARHRRDPRMNGELAAWLWRVGALDERPSDIAEPYALEISGDWRAAANAWRMLGCPYEHATLLGWHGTESDQREALVILEALGAGPAEHSLRRRMRERGVRRIPRGSRRSTRQNPYGLTRREAEVLALLSEGLRNTVIAKRLFLSTKTVEHHVSAVLAKLGVDSRIEAVTLTRRPAADKTVVEGLRGRPGSPR
jgi:DNA-binding CsgD family transcriptional regulator/tetratricopeptide (TPR) repeat protein